MATLIQNDTRRNRKNLAKAKKIGAPFGEVIAYVSGTGKLRFTEGLAMLIGCFVLLCVVVFMATGRILIPGFLVVIVGVGMVRPRRGVALMPNGLLVMHESMADATPKRILVHAPVGALEASIVEAADTVQSSVHLDLGTERIRMKRGAYDSLLRAARNLHSEVGAVGAVGVSQVQGPGWFPDPIGRYQHRYWSGSAWTEQVSSDGTVFVDSL